MRRKPSHADRRQLEAHLLAAGRKKLVRLAIQHADQLSGLAKAVRLAHQIEDQRWKL
ncbi:MAG: hypothetical protein H7255_07795 [Ramlibacter sp.]|nr:hypothetical protein [Ramlibacter sp.]